MKLYTMGADGVVRENKLTLAQAVAFCARCERENGPGSFGGAMFRLLCCRRLREEPRRAAVLLALADVRNPGFYLGSACAVAITER